MVARWSWSLTPVKSLNPSVSEIRLVKELMYVNCVVVQGSQVVDYRWEANSGVSRSLDGGSKLRALQTPSCYFKA
ncbi:hypothetical protein TNCV_1312861 [Trichonephila clavipes]|nr:hypothetical protein TNCV_1312861 [Trichonephila clavipes]